MRISSAETACYFCPKPVKWVPCDRLPGLLEREAGSLRVDVGPPHVIFDLCPKCSKKFNATIEKMRYK